MFLGKNMVLIEKSVKFVDACLMPFMHDENYEILLF